jgi:hypothetical protein
MQLIFAYCNKQIYDVQQIYELLVVERNWGRHTDYLFQLEIDKF